MGEPPLALPVTANQLIEMLVDDYERICKPVGASGATAATIFTDGDKALSPTSFVAYTIIS